MNDHAKREIQSEHNISPLKKAYRPISLALALVFALVGLIFLLAPESVYSNFDTLSSIFGMAVPGRPGDDFFRILAVSYMYLVSLLAFSMYRHPENRDFLFLLINAKSASSILSLLFFVFLHPYLLYLSNFIVDGAIASGLYILFIKTKGSGT